MVPDSNRLVRGALILLVVAINVLAFLAFGEWSLASITNTVLFVALIVGVNALFVLAAYSFTRWRWRRKKPQTGFDPFLDDTKVMRLFGSEEDCATALGSVQQQKAEAEQHGGEDTSIRGKPSQQL